MLKLINICKNYKCGKNKISVLDNINLDFKKKELVFILGKSGSGKSTLLNIIGGIIKPSSGDVMLDNKNITKFNSNMLSYYRNNMIGYIFQDYNLIEYMSVIDNIKLGQTITSRKSTDIDNVLKKLGIYDKKNIKVNRLSGGEKQRVAIARAIVNEPDIILCDEPTGALDSYNSKIIMDILKDISKEKLVIVVSHDNGLAIDYADRIINIADGKVEYHPQIDNDKFKEIFKRKIRKLSLFKLAIKNLCLKMGRTLFTSLAISIGFVCMLLVLCLSKSFNADINRLENDIVSIFPISIYNGDYEIVDSRITGSNNMIINKDKKEYIHTNKIDKDYIDYISGINEIDFISYDYDVSMPLVSDKYNILDNKYMKIIPNDNFIDNNYDVLYGNIPKSINEIVLKVDKYNNVDSELLKAFNIESDIEYSEIIDRKIRIILNDNYYVKSGNYYFIDNDNHGLYKNSNIELRIAGIVREKEIVDDRSYFYYSSELIRHIIKLNSKSKIVSDQLKSNSNVLGIDMDRDKLLSYLGYKTLPEGINIYVSNLDDKRIVLDKLDLYNSTKEKLVYVDTMNDAINILKDLINIITIILVIFSLISIIVSSLMVFILTNNRVMERVKEIGILRSLGAREKDITRLFNIENFVIGILSSIIGIVFIILISNPVNLLLENFIGDSIFKIYSDLVIINIIFNILIVVLSGYIPSKMASKKRIIDCISNRF